MGKLSLAGIVLLLTGLYLAFVANSPFWYSPFIIGGFLFFEGLNRPHQFSVLKNPRGFLITWFTFILITIGVEFVGGFWLHLWYYPAYGTFDYLIHVVLIGYAFTGFFGLELFVFVLNKIRSVGVRYIILPIVALLFWVCERISECLRTRVGLYKLAAWRIFRNPDSCFLVVDSVARGTAF